MQVLAVIVLAGFLFGGLPFFAEGHVNNNEQGEVEIPTFVFLTKTTPSSIVCEQLCLYSSRCVSSRWDHSTRNCQLYLKNFHKELRFEARRSNGDILMRKLQVDVKSISGVCSDRPCAEHEMCVPVEAGMAYLCLAMSTNVTMVTWEAAMPNSANYTTSTAATTITTLSTFLTTSFSVAPNSLTANISTTSSIVTAADTLSATVTTTRASATPYVTTAVRTIATNITASSTSTKSAPIVRATTTSTTTATAVNPTTITTTTGTTSEPAPTMTSSSTSSSTTDTAVAVTTTAAPTNTIAVVATTAAATTIAAATTTATTSTTTAATTTTAAAAAAATTTTTTPASIPITRSATRKPTTKSVNGMKKTKVSHRYVGCYHDSMTRILPHAMYESNFMTIDKCCSHCREKNYTYFGIEVGSQCFCGDVIPERSTKVSDEQCSERCSGTLFKKTHCGGMWRISVFKIG